MSPSKIILASVSPRRQELLATLKFPFEVVAPRFEELSTALTAAAEALLFAEQKAKSVASLYPDAFVIASDTLIDCEGIKMGKPRDAAEAVQMLTRLSGKTHQLYTAVVLLDTQTGVCKKHLETVAVTFKSLTQKTIEDYVATGEPLGKAGAYAIQGEAKHFVAKVDGDRNAVIGLPLEPIQRWLEKTTSRFIVGAYVASISLRKWNEEDETLFYKSLRARPLIRGLEHAFYGQLHCYDDEWFLKNIDPDWEFAFTCLPGTAQQQKNDPTFGLASNSAKGQQAAIEFIFAANQAVKKLNTFLQRNAVLAVQIHSAPDQNASKEAFAKALATICSWDWDGAKIIVEHCDAFRKDGAHEKGFLSLSDEVWAVQQTKQKALPTLLTMMLNWGRSVVEGRNTGHVLGQIERLKKEKLLHGFIFSGTTASYKDKHLPMPTPHKDQMLHADSLMTLDEVRKSLAALPLDDLDYLGFKIMPSSTPDHREGLIYIDYMLDVLQKECGKKK